MPRRKKITVKARTVITRPTKVDLGKPPRPLKRAVRKVVTRETPVGYGMFLPGTRPGGNLLLNTINSILKKKKGRGIPLYDV